MNQKHHTTKKLQIQIMASASASAFAFLFLFNLLLLSFFPNHSHSLDIGIGIGIGGGGSPSPPESSNCSSPPPPPPPTPSPPPKSSPAITPKPPPPPPPVKIPPSPPPRPKKQRPATRSSPRPPGLRFESERIRIAQKVIQDYKGRIENDPLNVTKTWEGADVCGRYRGFTCDKHPDFGVRAVAGASFNNFNFSGKKFTLFGLVDKLPDIAFFHANSNFFFGGVPTVPSKNVKFFYELDLSNNNFAGGFPAQVFTAVNLTFLDLRFNSFSGPVPPQLFDMDIISAIFLNNNKFSQQIPANLGNTPARFLTFTRNEFTGPIPRSIGIGKTKKNLIEVLFSGNKLSGCLPMEAGLLENAILLDASTNSLTGPIPHSFACLAKMELLNLADNRLHGAVPEVLCKLPHLGNLTLRNNFFTEVGPVCRKLMWKKILDVSGNCILGLPEQRSAKECTHFFSTIEHCPNEKIMRYIPCKGNPYLNGDPADHRPPPPRKMTEMRTYAALVPH